MDVSTPCIAATEWPANCLAQAAQGQCSFSPLLFLAHKPAEHPSCTGSTSVTCLQLQQLLNWSHGLAITAPVAGLLPECQTMSSPSLMDAATEDTSGVFVPSYESANVAASAGTDG